jgi:hypothetical protein
VTRAVLLSLFLTVGLCGAVAQDPELSVRLWCELEPLVEEGSEYPLSREEAQRRLLEEGRGVLSDMIYGLRFRYTPADSIRGVAEEFTLEPIAEIRWGDPALRIADAWQQDNLLHAKITYRLADFQQARRRAWQSTAIPVSMGSGEASLFTLPGLAGKRASLERAVREAIRNYMRPIHSNKPREIAGEIVLWSEPQVAIKSGAYLTVVQVKLQVREVRSYSLF